MERLFHPKSVALIGITDSSWQGSSGFRNLIDADFAGEIHLVNPRRALLFGRPCVPSIEAIGKPIDVAVIGLRPDLSVEALKQCVAHGVSSAIVFSDGFGESGPDGIRRQLELEHVARDAGVTLCGPNSMGVVSHRGRAPMWLDRLDTSRLADKGVAAVVQSGSVAIALLNSDRDLGVGTIVSAGNEAVTTSADYLEYLVERQDVQILVSHVETINDGSRYWRAASRARTLQKPFVVLKTGKTDQSQRVIAGHTGRVAGSDFISREVLAEAGAILVDSLSELVECLVLLTGPQRIVGNRTGVVTISGGFGGLAADAAGVTGISAPDVVRSSRSGEAVPNFVDAWAGGDFEATFESCLRAMSASQDVDLVVLVDELEPDPVCGTPDVSRLMASVTARVAADPGNPVVCIQAVPKPWDSVAVDTFRRGGVSVLSGLTEGFRAISRVGGFWSLVAATKDPATRSVTTPAGYDKPLSEHASMAWLADRGVGFPAALFASTPADAVTAAERIGFPVVLKGQAEGIVHKTDAGLVRLGVSSVAQLEHELEEMRSAFGSRSGGGHIRGWIVEEQVAAGLEVMCSTLHDDVFGPVTVVGFGGMLSEANIPRSARLAPISEETAGEMLAACGVSEAVHKHWGESSDVVVVQLARVVATISRAACEGQDACAFVEVNPIVVTLGTNRTLAVDALVQLPQRTQQDP